MTNSHSSLSLLSNKQQKTNTHLATQYVQLQQQYQQQQYQQPRYQQAQQPQQQFGAGLMAQFGIVGRSNGEGVTVVNVGMASRAATAGLVPGDDIKAIDGTQVSRLEEMISVLSQKNPAQRIPILIMRNGNLAVLNL